MAIGIIGRVDPSLVDGQTIKTRALVQQLRRVLPDEQIEIADVSSWKAHPLATLLHVRKCMEDCTDIFVMLSANGRRVVFPVICRMNAKLHRRIYHDIIGTGPVADARNSKKARKQLQSFTCNWVETYSGVESLRECGVTNASYLPNFKDLRPVDLAKLPHRKRPPYKYCTYSRVTADKGIGDAIAAVELLNAQDGIACRLDVYGPVDSSYKDEFEQLLQRSPHSSYAGVRGPDESVTVLSGYDALLFPTNHPTEGIPGTIIDALFAGLPVVASRWACYDQMLADSQTGYSYPYGHPEQLPDAIRRLISNSQSYEQMRSNCIQRSQEYSADNVMSIIVSRMRAEGYRS